MGFALPVMLGYCVAKAPGFYGKLSYVCTTPLIVTGQSDFDAFALSATYQSYPESKLYVRDGNFAKIEYEEPVPDARVLVIARTMAWYTGAPADRDSSWKSREELHYVFVDGCGRAIEIPKNLAEDLKARGAKGITLRMWFS